MIRERLENPARRFVQSLNEFRNPLHCSDDMVLGKHQTLVVERGHGWLLGWRSRH